MVEYERREEVRKGDTATHKAVDPVWFRNTAFLLRQDPEMEGDKDWQKVLLDFQKMVERTGTLTVKQYKLFGVIHQKIKGAWPKRPDPEAEKKEFLTAEDPPPF